MDEDNNNSQFSQGVPETLPELKKQGYILSITTDTANPLHFLLRWFENCGIMHVRDTIITSQEAGIQKPEHGNYADARQPFSAMMWSSWKAPGKFG